LCVVLGLRLSRLNTEHRANQDASHHYLFEH
jgi:hypothetical protein